MRSLSRSRPIPSRPVRLEAEGAVGWLRPSLTGRDLPAPESRTRRLAIRTIAIASIVVTAAYLGWRIGVTLDQTSWWVSLPLLGVEILGGIALIVLTGALWDVDRLAPAEPVLATADRIAVVIPTLDESLDILTPTIAAALAMRVDHETWVLDDGDRAEVAALAADLGARYLARGVLSDGLAGNLNHALGSIEADLVAVLHADSVAAPDFLANTLGYLSDPRIAVVQTPEGFYNTDSFEHGRRRDRARPVHERTFAHRLLQPGRNRWRGAFWTGTGAVLRVSAIREIGGIATGTLAPDQHTTLRLHRRGWDTVAHNEVLARGLSPTTAAIDLVRRQRRAVGAMGILRVESPLIASRLRWDHRLAHSAALLAWFDAWRWLAIIVLPIAILLTSANPIQADLPTFALFFALTYGLQAVAQLALSRGCRRPLLSTLIRIVRMTADLKAIRHLFADRTSVLEPSVRGATPKGRTSEVRRPATEPRLLRSLAMVSVFAAAWFALAIMVTLFTETPMGWASYASWAWLFLNVLVLGRAIGRVRDLRFGGERRASVRFETSFSGAYDGGACEVLDVSLRGVGVRLARPVSLETDRLMLEVDGRRLEFAVDVRSMRADERGGSIVGLEFRPGQNHARAVLALALFRTTVVPAADGRLVGRRVPTGVGEIASGTSESAAA